jgi:hypothetical protein
METRKVLTVVAIVALMAMAAAPAFAAWRPPPANQSMHNVQQSEQRNVTGGGAGIPGGENPYFPTMFPLPSPTVQVKPPGHR